MKNITQPKTFLHSRNVCLLAACLLILSPGCRKILETKVVNQDFTQVNLVSNDWDFNPAHFDSSLQNAWGLAWAPSGIAWVNSQAGHVSELYDQNGAKIRAAVNIPSPKDSVGGNPTGIVFNSVRGFTLADGKPAAFLFDGVDGVLSGWNGNAGNNAFRIGAAGGTSSYTGLALATSKGVNYLYAANFGMNRIDVWDTGFVAIKGMPFKDPNLPGGFAPFNIQAIGSWLYVTYAKVGKGGRDEAGIGNGFVDIFNTDGSWVKRFASHGSLNSPWGIVLTPANFLPDDNSGSNNSGSNNSGNNNSGNSNSNNNNSGNGNSNGGSNNGGNGNSGSNNSGNGDSGNGSNNSGSNNSGDDNGGKRVESTAPVILVGNFGDGRISVFSEDGNFLGLLESHKRIIVIDGLWALSFPPITATAIPPGRLYFTAGPKEGKDGLFGYLISQ